MSSPSIGRSARYKPASNSIPPDPNNPKDPGRTVPDSPNLAGVVDANVNPSTLAADIRIFSTGAVLTAVAYDQTGVAYNSYALADV